MGPLSVDLRSGWFGGSRGRHELPCGGAAVRGELFQRIVGWRRCASAAATRVADGRRHASQRVEAHTDFLLRFIGASLTLRSTKSATVWSVREARRCRRL